MHAMQTVKEINGTNIKSLYADAEANIQLKLSENDFFVSKRIEERKVLVSLTL